MREAIKFALAGAIAEDVFSKLQANGGVDDVFGKLPPEEDEEGERQEAERRPSEAAEAMVPR